MNVREDKFAIDVVKQKEDADKRLLFSEILLGMFSLVILFGCVLSAAFVLMANWLRICLIIVGVAITIVGCAYALKIEQVAGYYKCAKCDHRYVPTFNSVLWAPHVGRTRYMRCPSCNKKSWNKKVLSKK